MLLCDAAHCVGVQIAYYAIIFSQFSMMVLSVLLAIGVYTVSLYCNAFLPFFSFFFCCLFYSVFLSTYYGGLYKMWIYSTVEVNIHKNNDSRWVIISRYVNHLKILFLHLIFWDLFVCFSNNLQSLVKLMKLFRNISGKCGACGSMVNWNFDFYILRGFRTCLRKCSQGSNIWRKIIYFIHQWRILKEPLEL